MRSQGPATRSYRCCRSPAVPPLAGRLCSQQSRKRCGRRDGGLRQGRFCPDGDQGLCTRSLRNGQLRSVEVVRAEHLYMARRAMAEVLHPSRIALLLYCARYNAKSQHQARPHTTIPERLPKRASPGPPAGIRALNMLRGRASSGTSRMAMWASLRECAF